jgi:signal transduction histidine kinase
VSLRTRIMLVALLAISVVALLNIRLVSNSYRDRYQVLVTERASVSAHDLASQINRLLSLGLYLHEFSDFDKQLDKMVDDNPGIRQAAIIDRNQRLLYQSQLPAWPPLVTDYAQLINAPQHSLDILFASYPLGPDKQDPLGYIIVVLNAQMIDDEITSFMYSMLLYMALAVALGMGLLYLLLNHYLGKPTNDLLRSIREARLDAGYHPMQKLLARHDEIGLVARTFDELIEGLSNSSHQLAEQRNRALAADRAKSQFLANISHELLTPLNGITGMAHLLGRSPLDEAQRSRLDRILSSGEHLRRIVSDILDFSSIDSGAMQLETAPLNLRQLVTDCLKGQTELAQEKGISLAINVDDRLPDGLLGDARRLAQVLQNLVNNAIKFNPAGTRAQLNLQLARIDDTHVVVDFSIEDNGIGMPGELIDRLFQPFDQADNSNTRAHGGTGLGLVISRHIVALMGGDIVVSSQPQQGSRFYFTLEFARGALAP